MAEHSYLEINNMLMPHVGPSFCPSLQWIEARPSLQDPHLHSVNFLIPGLPDSPSPLPRKLKKFQSL